MKKSTMILTTTALLLTGGYYASAHGIPHLYIRTTTTRPTSSASSVSPTLSPSRSSSTSSSTPSHSSSSATRSRWGIPDFSTHFSRLSQAVNIHGGRWLLYSFNGVTFAVKPSWVVIQNTRDTLFFAGRRGGVRVVVTPGSVYGSYWSSDLAHFRGFSAKTLLAPESAFTPTVKSLSPHNHHTLYRNVAYVSKVNSATLATSQAVYSVSYTNVPIQYFDSVLKVRPSGSSSSGFYMVPAAYRGN